MSDPAVGLHPIPPPPELEPQHTRPRRQLSKTRKAQIVAAIAAFAVLAVAAGAFFVLQPRGTRLEQAISACNLEDSRHVTLKEAGTLVTIYAADLLETSPGLTLEQLGCFNKEFGTPRSMIDQTLRTSSADDWVDYRGDTFLASWQYASDTGFVIIIADNGDE